jgi:Ca2+-binding RTX toxin-like protein
MLSGHTYTKSLGAKSRNSEASIWPDGIFLVGEVNSAFWENYTNFAPHEFNLLASTWEPLIGTNANDFVTNSGVTDDTLIGLAGHDTLLGFGGVDLLFGGDGNDLLDGGDLADWLYGDSGDDTLHGSDGHDVLYADNQAEGAGDTNNNRNFLSGGTGDDILLGAWGKDSLEGNDGNDLLIGGVSGDFLEGGAGADIFLIDLSTFPQSVSNLLSADTIADFSLEEQDILSFGLAGGVVNSASGPAPLVWSGVMAAPNGPELGLVLPDNGIGSGFVQAWLIAAAPSETSSGVWCAIDLDQNGLLGVEDILIQVQMPLLQATNLYRYAAPGSFGGLAGDARDDVLTALSEGSWVFGLGGADALLGQAATDRLLGGDGNDSLAGYAGDDLLWGGAGSDWVLGGTGHDAIYAEGMALGDEDDSAALNSLEGEEGNDSLFGGLGLDLLFGGNGSDFLYGGDGHDTLEGGTGNDTLIGSDGDDMLAGGGGTDSIDGGSGNDRIVWADNLDSLDGGDGFDWLIVSAGLFVDLGLTENQIVGGSWTAGFEAVDGRSATASMTLLGSADGSYLISGVENDTLFGGAGDDILQSGAGSDTLNGGTGFNILEGGTGNDLYIGVGPDDLILENFAEGLDTIISAFDFYLPPEIETLVLAPSSAATRGFGGSGNNFLLGNANNNELVGGDGGDTINGADGADTLNGGPGSDSLSGGAGSDWVVYSEVSPLGAGVIVNLAMLLADDAAGIDTLSGIENILTGDGADSLSGDAFGNMISAAAGNDSIFGDAGDDTLVGGAGADTMGGGAGDDLFFVLDAGDLVIENAGGGADTIMTSVSMTMPDHVDALQIASDISGITLIGGAGNDMLIGSGLSNIFIGGAGDDVILAGNVTLADIFALFTI